MTAHLPAVPTAAETAGARQRARRGDMAATEDDFAEFVRVALPGLMRYGHALTGNPHDAADLVQAVLEKVGARWAKVSRNCGDPTAYVRRAMANTHVSRWRRTRRETLLADFPDVPAQAQPDRLENEPLWQALRSLPPRQRAVVVLRYYEGLSELEIAESLGVSCGTVKSQASKAMASLRKRLGSLEGGDV
ncbi:SigE family RNA polymerase sigma factor [Saccharopolyspora oryzae]